MDIKGFKVPLVYCEAALDIEREIYVGFTVDRDARANVLLVSAKGGIDIEQVAEESPDAIARLYPNPWRGPLDFQLAQLVYDAGLGDLARPLTALIKKLYRAIPDYDALTAEINPLVVTKNGDVVAGDAKLEVDDNAAWRHKDLEQRYGSVIAGDPYEVEAKKRGLTYVSLDGDIGIIGNGAGLCMSTLDLVQRAGARAANFCDIGGGAKAEVVENALAVILMNPRVTGVLINGFGGITRGEEVGTNLVGGTSPGKGGTTHVGVPVFNTVAEAVNATGANASGIFVPPPFAPDAIMEAAANGIELIVCITEGIPIQDMIRVKDFLRGYPNTRLLGPNCPGLITPGAAKIGIIPQRITSPGHVGLVSRSGTLTYEVGSALTAAGMGQSTIVGIGGDPVLGLTFRDVGEMFEQDPQTTHLVVIGEIGGSDEERAAEMLGKGSRLKAGAFISGRTAPEGKRMGHAGAIISGNRGTAKSKEEAFKAAGVAVAETTDDIVGLLR